MLAALLGAALLAYFMGRALPHGCDEALAGHHAHSADGPELSSDCALCDLALPVAAATAAPPALPVIAPVAIELPASAPCAVVLRSAPSAARGPPAA